MHDVSKVFHMQYIWSAAHTLLWKWNWGINVQPKEGEKHSKSAAYSQYPDGVQGVATSCHTTGHVHLHHLSPAVPFPDNTTGDRSRRDRPRMTTAAHDCYMLWQHKWDPPIQQPPTQPVTQLAHMRGDLVLIQSDQGWQEEVYNAGVHLNSLLWLLSTIWTVCIGCRIIQLASSGLA